MVRCRHRVPAGLLDALDTHMLGLHGALLIQRDVACDTAISEDKNVLIWQATAFEFNANYCCVYICRLCLRIL